MTNTGELFAELAQGLENFLLLVSPPFEPSSFKPFGGVDF